MKLFLTNDVGPEVSGEYWIDQKRRVSVEEYRGLTVLGDFRRIMSSMASDPCWSADYNALVDLGEAKLQMSSNDILRLALSLRHGENRTWGWLVYVATDTMTYGLLRMLGHWARTTERTRIFHSRSEAEQWLDWNRDQVPPQSIERKASPPAMPALHVG